MGVLLVGLVGTHQWTCLNFSRLHNIVVTGVFGQGGGDIRSFVTLLAACLLSALLSVAAVLGLQDWQAKRAPKAVSEKPGTAYIEAFKCGRGLNRIVLMGGREDGFDQSDNEPARINPARFPNPYLETIRDTQNGMMTLRDYDEGGQDKVLIDYFDVPRGIVSGQLVLVQKPFGSQTYDGLKLGDLQNLRLTKDSDPFFGMAAFNFSFDKNRPAPIQDDRTSGLLVLDLAVPAFVSGSVSDGIEAPYGSMLGYLNQVSRPDVLDIQIQDDTAVDFVALVMCQIPAVAKGTSFVEFSSKPIAPEISMLSCQSDPTQQPCNPFQGDQLCASPLPLACYNPAPKAALINTKVPKLRSGEVRTSRPVVGSQLPDLQSADAVCAQEFGPGWRVLAYHDGDSGAMVTLSNIAPKTRLWIDVRDQQYGNCWDRDKPRLKQ
jgi:hypothetical protein